MTSENKTSLSAPSESLTPVWLRRFTKLTAVSTLFLIFAGAMVTSTGSGLAVPDWPLAYGMVFPPMVGGIFYEHGHRLIATLVGFFTLVQALWLQRSEPNKSLRVLGWISLLTVVIQGLLGGLTVIFLLPTAVSVAHASLAEIFFCLNLAIAFLASRFAARLQEGAGDAGIASIGKFLVASVFVQIVIGALMRHLGAGLAIPDWPLSFGRIIPPIGSLAVATNFAHRTLGLLLAIAVLALGPVVFRRAGGAVRGIYVVLMATTVVQVLLGGVTILSGKAPVLTSLHVMVGALVLGLTLVFALSAHRIEARGAGAREHTQEAVV